MPRETLAVVAVAVGGVLSLVGTTLYLRDVRRGRTVPHRGSWLVWSVIGVLAAASHGASGARWSLALLWLQALTTLSVLVLAGSRGTGSLTRTNVAMLTVAALGVVGWLLVTDPILATACAAVADGVGLLAIVPKAWSDPHSETAATYGLAAVTGLLAVVAVQDVDVALLLFPLYYCVGNGLTALWITVRRRAFRYQLRCAFVLNGQAGATTTLPRTRPLARSSSASAVRSKG